MLDVPSEYCTTVERAVIRRVSATAIQGESHQTGSDGWQKYTLYVVARFSKPFYATGGWEGTNITPDVNDIAGKGDVGAFASYHTAQDETIEVRTGISLRSLLLFLYGTAVRTGEAPRLRLADVDLDYGVVTIRETKFYESRLVPLGSDVVQLLRKYLATPGRWNRHDQPLFQSRQHNPRPI